MKKSSKKEEDVPRINKAFAKLIADNGTQTQASEMLGFRTQDIGKYMKGRAIPSELIAACRKKYGYDLIELEELDFENMILKKKELVEPIVSRGTPPTTNGLTLELWEEIRINNQQFRKTHDDDVQEKKSHVEEKKELLKQNGQLIDIFHDLSRRGVFPHK